MSMTTTRRAPQAMALAHELVTPALRSAVDRLGPEVRPTIHYHMGWTDTDGQATNAHGGKALRPALALASARAVGASPEVAIPGAVAVELIHNFSLVHDDVMDRDGERRHRPTVWALFGEGEAILAGDALAALAQSVLLEDPSPQRVRACAALAAATTEMIVGQALDLSFETRSDVSVDECRRMAGRKTGTLLSYAGSVGAILAGAPEEVTTALADFGAHLGLAFQAIDDILGIWGRPDTTGKPVGNDLRQHKKTLPIVAALAAHRPESAELARLLARGALNDVDVARAVELCEVAGGRRWTLEEADRQLRRAFDALGRISLDSDVREELGDIARFVTARKF